MALPPQYRPGAPAQTARLNLPDPAASGIGLTRDIQAAGQMIAGQARENWQADEAHLASQERVAAIADERVLNAKKADRSVALIEMRASLTERAMQRGSTIGDPAAYATATQEDYATTRDAFMGTLDDPRLIDHFKPLVADVGGDLSVDTMRRTVAARGDKVKNDTSILRERVRNDSRTDPAPEKMATTLKAIDSYTAALPVPQTVRDAYAADMRAEAYVGQGEALAERAPDALLEAIDKGIYDKQLSSEQIGYLRRQAEGVVAARAREAAAVATDALDADKQAGQTFVERVGEGADVDPAQGLAVAARLRATNDPALVEQARDIENAAAATSMLQGYRGRSPAEIDRGIAEIESKKGWRTDDRLIAARKAMVGLRDTTAKALADDPMAFRRATGGEVTPLDFANPVALASSFTARVAEARRTQARYGGGFKPLSAPEVGQLRAVAARDTNGALIVADTLARAGQDSVELAAQVFPDDRAMQWVPQLVPAYRELAIRGSAIRREKGWSGRSAKNETLFREATQGAIAAYPEFARQAAYEAARNIAATMVSDRNAEALPDATFTSIVNMVFGARGQGAARVGGIGDWGGYKALLPRWATQAQFEAGLMKPMPWGDNAAATRAADGSTIPLPVSALRRYRPVPLGGDIYAFEDGRGNRVKAKNGADYRKKVSP